MKQALILLMVASLIFGCKTTKLDVSNGDKNPTWNTRHMRKIHPYGFWAGKKYIQYSYPKKQGTFTYLNQ